MCREDVEFAMCWVSAPLHRYAEAVQVGRQCPTTVSCFGAATDSRIDVVVLLWTTGSFCAGSEDADRAQAPQENLEEERDWYQAAGRPGPSRTVATAGRVSWHGQRYSQTVAACDRS